MKDNITCYGLFQLHLIMMFRVKGWGIISDNDAPYYDGVPTVIENYINRLFIDLIRTTRFRDG